jgi:hypothetical protein
MSEGFEGQWPSAGWLLIDYSADDGGEFLWAKRDCRPRTGSFAAWAIGGGAQGSALDCAALYPDNTRTWLIYGPFDLSQATAASLTFYFRGESQAVQPCGLGDRLFVGSSVNGGEFSGFAICGNWLNGPENNGYHPGILDLTPRLGQLQVWVALTMISDGSGAKQGFMIDDLVLTAEGIPDCKTPAAPVLSAPANGSTTDDQTPAFDWNDVQDTSVYNFALYDEATIATPVLTATLDNSSYIPTGPLTAGTFFWRVRAHNAAGGCDQHSAWSDLSSVTIDDQPHSSLYQLYLPLAAASGFYFAGPWEAEPNDGEGEANGPIHLDQNYFGYPDDQEDYFRFDLPTAATILVELSNHTGDDPQLQLYYNSVTLPNLVGAATASPYQIQIAAQPGTYFVRIVAVGDYNQTTPYTLRVSD